MYQYSDFGIYGPYDNSDLLRQISSMIQQYTIGFPAILRFLGKIGWIIISRERKHGISRFAQASNTEQYVYSYHINPEIFIQYPKLEQEMFIELL